MTPAPSRRADELIGLQEVLERLPETQRRAILLREWQGLSYREIAAELELSQGAVETLIFRARRSLASGLEQPVESKRRRVARAFDRGNVLAGLKAALIGGSVAAKVAATVAVVSATTVVAAEPLQHQCASCRAERAEGSAEGACGEGARGRAVYGARPPRDRQRPAGRSGARRPAPKVHKSKHVSHPRAQSHHAMTPPH